MMDQRGLSRRRCSRSSNIPCRGGVPRGADVRLAQKRKLNAAHPELVLGSQTDIASNGQRQNLDGGIDRPAPAEDPKLRPWQTRMVPRFFKRCWNCIGKQKRTDGPGKMRGVQGRAGDPSVVAHRANAEANPPAFHDGPQKAKAPGWKPEALAVVRVHPPSRHQ